MTPQTVCLRADPARVRVAVRRVVYAGEPYWRVAIWARRQGKWRQCTFVFDADPARAVEAAIERAAGHRAVAVYPDGAEFLHPQRREP